MAKDSKQKPLAPGLYHGRRSAVPGKSPWNHGYVAAIPKDEKQLPKKVRRSVRKIGPNGERGFIVSSDVHRKAKDFIPGKTFAGGKMTSGVNINKGDAKDFRKGSPKGLKRLGKKRKDVDKLAAGMHRSGEKFPDVEYPGLGKNLRGEGKNSNTFVRTALKQNGIRQRGEKALPGSKLTFAEQLDVPISEFRARTTDEKERRGRPRKRTTLQNVRDGALTAAGVAGVVGAGIVTRKGIQGVKAVTKRADQTLNQNRQTMNEIARVANNAKKGSEIYGDAGGVYIKGKGWVKDAAKELKTGGNLKAGLKEGRKPGTKEHAGHKIGRATGNAVKKITSWDEALDQPISEFQVTLDQVKDAHRQSKAVYRQAKTTGRNLRRAKDLAKDTKDAIKGKPREKDRAGRQKMREYEKEWFKGAMATGSGMLAIGAGLGAKALAKGKSGPVANAINDPVGTGARMVGKLKSKKKQPEFAELDPALLDLPLSAISEFTEAKKQGSGSTWIRDADGNKVLRVTDARGHGARVYGPKSKRRDRRKKRPEERIENERKRHARQKGLIAGVGATAAAATGLGVHLASRGRLKRSVAQAEHRGAKKVADEITKHLSPKQQMTLGMNIRAKAKVPPKS